MLKQLSKELGIPEKTIEKVYKYYWRFIKEKLEELSLKEELDKEYFNNNKTSINLPFLGKLYCSYESWLNTIKSKEYAKNKRNKTSS